MKEKIRFYIILTLILVTGILIIQTILKPIPQGITGVQTLETGKQQSTQNSITGLGFLQPQDIHQIDTCIGDLSSTGAINPGDTVELKQDIYVGSTDCLNIDIANITLDCKHHKIIGNSSSSANGIVSNKTNDATVKGIIRNCHFYNFTNKTSIYTGKPIVLKEGAKYFLIHNNTFNVTRGITLNKTIDVTIANNTFANYSTLLTLYTDAEIYINGNLTNQTNETTIYNNTFEGIGISTNKPYAIYAIYANDLTIQGNTILTSNQITLDGVHDFYLKENALSRVEIKSQSSNTTAGRIERNTYIDTSTAMHFTSFSPNELSNISIYKHDMVNFSLSTMGSGVEQIKIYNNTFAGPMSIDLGSANNCTIWNNTFYPDEQTQITTGPNSKVRNNRIQNGIFKTITVTGDNTTVENNIFTKITGRGIVVKANNATVRNNTFNNITGIAIIIGDDTWQPPSHPVNVNGTTVYNNTIYLWVNLTTNTTMHSLLTGLPAIPGASTGIMIMPNTNNTNISENNINEQNIYAQTPPNMLKAETRGIFGKGINATYTLENLWIHDNTINTIREGITVENCQTTHIWNNNITKAGKTGIKTENCRGTRVNNNILEGGTYSPNIILWYKTGIEIFKSRAEIIQNNKIDKYHTGVYIYNATNTTSINSTINQTQIGIFSFLSMNNKLINNTVTTRHTGINLLKTNHTLINNSNIRNETGYLNTTGIQLSLSFYNNITSNTITQTSRAMFITQNSAYNNITSNTLDHNVRNIILDLYSNNNNGTNNVFKGGPSLTETTNFAHDNSIT